MIAFEVSRLHASKEQSLSQKPQVFNREVIQNSSYCLLFYQHMGVMTVTAGVHQQFVQLSSRSMTLLSELTCLIYIYSVSIHKQTIEITFYFFPLSIFLKVNRVY